MPSYIFIFQNFLCPPQCLCKGHAIYCVQTAVNMRNIPENTTLLYLTHATSSSQQGPVDDKQLSNICPHLSLLNMTSCRLAPQDVYDFLLRVPNLRVLLMTNASLTNLRMNFFVHLQKLNVLDLQGNHIYILTSRCFFGSSGVHLLDLHGMSISTIHFKSFEGMTSLRLLNLSHNNLERLSSGIVQSIAALSIIDLRGNILKDIHVLLFHGKPLMVYTSTLQMCCFAPSTSMCYVPDFRYTNKIFNIHYISQKKVSHCNAIVSNL